MHAFTLLAPVTAALVAASLAQAQHAPSTDGSGGLERRIVLTPEMQQYMAAHGGFHTPLATINGHPLSMKVAERGFGDAVEDDAALARRAAVSPQEAQQLVQKIIDALPIPVHPEVAKAEQPKRRFVLTPEEEQRLQQALHHEHLPLEYTHGVRPLSANVQPAQRSADLEDADVETAEQLARRIVITPEMQAQLAAEGKSAPYFPSPPELPNHVRPQILRRSREYDVAPQRRLAPEPSIPEESQQAKKVQDLVKAIGGAFIPGGNPFKQREAGSSGLPARSAHPLS